MRFIKKIFKFIIYSFLDIFHIKAIRKQKQTNKQNKK